MGLHSKLEKGFIRIAEEAAIAAAKTMGLGERKHSDHVAVEAMRVAMNSLEMDGRIVIGEGERDKAPMLWVGEEVGAAVGDSSAVAVDIAVDPLEGTNLCARPSGASSSPPASLPPLHGRSASARRGPWSWPPRWPPPRRSG